jgi:hypothetical protein
MASKAADETRPNGRWIPSLDVRISEKRGISNARDPKTGLLKSGTDSVNGRSPRKGKRA